jgi:pentafunctional AROM polypeptide
LNPVFTPVTHPLLPGIAAPGQLCYAEVQQGLALMGQVSKKRFFLFGSPVKASQSPLIHNTGFKTLGLPHFYDRHETPVIDETIKELIRADDFGGASVTIPLKLDIIALLDHVTEHAKHIGAVNTIIPSKSKRSGQTVLTGDNTDWLAICDLAGRKLQLPGADLAGISSSGRVAVDRTSSSLVIGAGGTCRAAVYALHQMGFNIIYVYNRTPANIVKIINSFPNDFNIVPLTSFDSFPLGPPTVIVSTVPAAATTTSKLEYATGLDAIFLPESILQKEPAGVVVDMAYKPRRTPLVEMAEPKGWTCVTGIELLLQQAYHQFSRWTGKKAPESTIAETVMPVYNSS